MRILQERLIALMAMLFLALAVSTEPVAIAAGVAAVLIVAVVASLVTDSRELTVGARAHAHRDALTTQPSPAHPSTAGRPRTRAPSMAVSAA